MTLAQSIWFGGDFFQIFYPFGLELERALNAGRLPLWTNNLLAGYPLLAEGEIGALYPPNLLLFRWLPAQLALSYSLLFHLAWAGCGMYLLTRALGSGRSGAIVAGLAFSFNGFLFAHLAHPPLVAASAWLPWLLLFQNRLQAAHVERRSGAAIWLSLLAFAFGLQFLAGSMQASLMNVFTLGCFGLAGRWLFLPDGRFEHATTTRLAREMFVELALPVLLGVGLAAVQLLPSAELVGYSIRSGGLSEAEFTNYSLPPSFLTQFLSPYLSGEPSGLNTEFFAYFGLTTVILAVLALWLRRGRRVFFMGLFALIALVLALGSWNPLYHLLYYIPFLNYFRVPARYLLLFILPMALLAGMAVDELARGLATTRQAPSGEENDLASANPLNLSKSGRRIVYGNVSPGAGSWPGVLMPVWVCILLVAAGMVLSRLLSSEAWLTAWQILPVLLALFTLGLAVAARARRVSRAVFYTAILGLVLCDLLSYAPPFFAAVYQDVPPSYVESMPRSILALDKELAATRTFTDLSFYPSLPALRGSLFPNTALIFDKPTVQAYTSLSFSKHVPFLNDASPAMLNLLNAGYYMIPLETLAPSVAGVPGSNVALDLSENPAVFSPQSVSLIRVASYTEQAARLARGTKVGEIDLQFDDRTSETLPLRVGIETADWDYDRTNATNTVPYGRPQIAHSFPAFWRAYGKLFEGYSYLASYELGANGSTHKLTELRVRPALAEGRLVVEGVWLVDAAGHSVSLATLTHKNNFTLVFQSDTVAVWRNEDVMPRAWVAHTSEVTTDEEAVARLRESGFPVKRTVLLAEGQAAQNTGLAGVTEPAVSGDLVEITQDLPGRVSLDVTASQSGYLVLADSWYPGWNAAIDGRTVPIYRADVILRAVPLTPGQHTVLFEYRPMSFGWGLVITGLSLVVILAIAFVKR